MESPSGERKTARMPPAAYLQIVAATNFKQRVRKMMEYYHADRLNYAVAGTPNRLEYDQGFFVKLGDGAADIKPIAHLYKTQVYALAEYLGVPDEIRRRPPTTDTFSLPQTQEEFYFALPYDKMDLCLYGRNHGVPAGEVAAALGLTAEQVERVYRDIDQKRRTTRVPAPRPLLADRSSHGDPRDEIVARRDRPHDLVARLRHVRHRRLMNRRADLPPPEFGQLGADGGRAAAPRPRRVRRLPRSPAPASRTRACRSSTSRPASSR